MQMLHTLTETLTQVIQWVAQKKNRRNCKPAAGFIKPYVGRTSSTSESTGPGCWALHQLSMLTHQDMTHTKNKNAAPFLRNGHVPKWEINPLNHP